MQINTKSCKLTFGSWTYDDSRIYFDIIPWNNKTDADFLKCLSENDCGNRKHPREECEKCYLLEPMQYEKNGVIVIANRCNF